MSRKVLQIGYEPERDRLTWDGWDIHCGQGMDVLLPDRLDGGTWRAVSLMRDGICLGILMCLRWACGHVKDRTKL